MITAHIIITPKRSVLDPQGEAVKKALHSLGLEKIKEARVGKFIELELSEASTPALQEKLEAACRDLLSNPVIEDYLLNLDAADNVPAQAEYEGLEEPDLESEEELTRLEAKPKKAVKKLAKAEKEQLKESEALKKAAKVTKTAKEEKKPEKVKAKAPAKTKEAPKLQEIKDLSEARPKKDKKAGPAK